MNCISLRKFDYSESSQIISVLTENAGKIKLIAKGIKRDKKSLDGPIDTGIVYDIRYIDKRDGLGILTDCKLKYSFPLFRKNIEKLALFYMLIEITDGLAPEKANIPNLYNCVTSFAYKMEQASNPYPHFVFALGRVVALAGYMPKAEQCVECLSTFFSAGYFSPSKGGIVCSRCEPFVQDANRVSGEVIAAIKLCNSNIFFNKKILQSKQTLLDLLRIYIYYYGYILDRGLKSSPFVLEMVKSSELINEIE